MRIIAALLLIGLASEARTGKKFGEKELNVISQLRFAANEDYDHYKIQAETIVLRDFFA